VGKSTVSVHLAVALHQADNSVGLIDADVLGPSIPGMLGLPVGEPPEVAEDGRIIPPERHGLKAVSMGMLRGDDNPAILRGPMVGKYLHMFVAGVQWGQLDYLILDRPCARRRQRGHCRQGTQRLVVGAEAGDWNGLADPSADGDTRHPRSPSRPERVGRSDAEVRAVIQELLDGEVNQSIANHGGQISIVDVHAGVLSIAMGGGCQGCASSKVTLRHGFEVMVRRVAPEIVDLVDTTDHAAGTKPFYERKK